MGEFCNIPGCKSSARKHKALFRIPYENEESFDNWKQNLPDNIDFNETNPEFFVCEDHFEDYYLIRSDLDTFLSPDAYPTIFKSSVKLGRSLADQTNNCRFCLKKIANKDGSLINESTRKYFRNITSLELNSEKIYSEKMCSKCSNDLKYCSTFKNRLISNQKRLFEFFENLEFEENCKEINENLEVKLEVNGEESNQKKEDDGGQKEAGEDPYNYYDVKNEGERYYDQPSGHSTEPKVRKIKLSKEKRNFSKEKVICPECGCYFTRASLRAHRERVHLKLKNFECDYCGRSFYLKDAIKEHLKTHIGIRNHVCPQCNKAFLTRGTLKMHIDKTHLQKYIVYCHYCGKKFTNKGNFRIHIRSAHTGERPFACDFVECGKAFFSVYELRTHKKNVHCDPVTCPICLKIFSSPNTLKSHIKLSHGEKNIVCQTCGKKYHTNYLLRQHQKTHLGQKNYECTLCGVRYYKSADLNRHIRAYHMKIKLKCELPGCNSQFARKETYKNHVISHHKDMGDENLRLLLDKIKHFQLPKIDLINISVQ